MGLLYSCFNLMESMLTTRDLRRWHFLGFFMNPLTILLLELCLAAGILLRLLVSLSTLPSTLLCFAMIAFSHTMRRLVLLVGLDDASITELYGFPDEDEQVLDRFFPMDHEEDPSSTLTLYTPPVVKGFITMSEEEPPNSPPLAEEEQLEIELEVLTASTSQNHGHNHHHQYEEDGIYQQYSRRMREIDTTVKTTVSYMSKCTRVPLCAMMGFQRAIFGGVAGDVLLGVKTNEVLGDMKTHMKMLDRRYAVSVELKLEMAYVEQLCLSWEAIERCHRRFEELAADGWSGGVRCGTADQLQLFRLRLERFLEDESVDWRYYKGKRFWNYTHGRWACKDLLLQFPDVSVVEGESEHTTAREVLMIVDDCIRYFSKFIEEDNVKSTRKFGSLDLDGISLLEDVNDLGLLDFLVLQVQKMERGLKKVQRGKRHWWKKRTTPVGKLKNVDILFAMIDVKVVSRVLMTPLLSTKHLTWCHEKLSGIELREGGVARSSTVCF